MLDSYLCNAELTSCIGPRAKENIVQTNNTNKILHRLPNGLLVCGSVRQGTCEIRSLDNLSQIISKSTVPVAANARNASTVSMVDDAGEKLFVAATYSYDSPYREGVPAVTTRLLYNFQPINSGGIESESAVTIRAEYRARFLVNYIGVFRHNKFVYWATVQNKYVGSTAYSKKVTKLIRVCQDDDKYVSYSEIEIQCRSEDNTNFNILKAISFVGNKLVGVFTDDETAKDSAICIFRMEQIQVTFWWNIDRCRSGTETIGLPHIGRDSKCINKSHLPLGEDTCLLGVGGTIEASQLAAVVFPNRILTTVGARVVDDKGIVIAGTNEGEIIQMSMSGQPSNYKLEKYAEFVIGTAPVSKIIFQDDFKFLTVVGKELQSLRVSICQQYTTCNACVVSHDPFCGWCLREGKCSSKADCQTGTLTEQKCPYLRGPVSPTNHSIHSKSDKTVFVPVSHLPSAEKNQPYECYFGAFKSTGHWSSTGVKCALPEHRPTILPTSNHVTVPLSVRTPLSRNNIVAYNFTFYDCGSSKTCSLCSDSEWPCVWCLGNEPRCKSTTDSCENPLSTLNCPKINMEKLTEVLVPDSTNTSISFPVVNMDENDGKSLSCRFRVPDESQKIVQVPAQMKQDKIICSSAKFSYQSGVPLKNYTFELLNSGSMIEESHISVYKCNEMASDCSQCLSLDPKWRCTWCKSGCHFEGMCGPLKSTSAKADTLCNEPVIVSFSPQGGPIEGGTKIEIRGRDLGSRIQDVTDRVMVAGSKCRVVDYEISVKITCIVEKGTGSGPIRITVGRTGKRYVESKEHYFFKEAVPKSIYPSFGPVSGGTKLSITGWNLDIGSNVSVYLDNLPCKVLERERSSSEIVCVTSKSKRTYDVSAVRVQIDDAVSVFDSRFSYRPDPTVDSISPTASFVSGGRIIVVEGQHFDSILSAKMFLLSSVDQPIEIVSELSDCQITNATQMLCTSPAVILPTNLRNIDLSSYARWPVGFIMDDVQEVRNLGYRVQMTTVPDPQFTSFSGIKVQSADQPLIIQGDFLAQAATLDEYTVTIGTERCPVFVLEAHQLLCRLPTTLPAATDDTGMELNGGHPMVVVRVGQLRVELGLLEYDDVSALLRMNTKRLFFIIGSAMVIFITAAILIVILWRRRSNEHERDYKRIQMQMEQMETSVRNECKQAFAELQTDMSDLTMAIDDAGIPYNDRAEFVSRLLFRDFSELSLLSGYNSPGRMGVYTSQMPIVMGQFDSLFWNRQFLFIFVEMIEKDLAMAASERSLIASLMIAALSRNMSYCTDIVLSLLSLHIEQMAQGKKNVPLHLLFRQSDSLIEKLFQHWLTICLYPYLCDPSGPGRNFYLLYKALKCQTEKGPVDVTTGNARYSLSEQKLLRESVDAHPINLMIIPVDGFDQAPIHCRVLQCDTISQVKSKFLDLLYKNQPFTQRLTIDNFDLEWRCPKRGSILLLDDDRPQVKGIKRLNTVGYYNIPNNALLAMQSRNQHSFTFRSGSSDTTCSAWSSQHLIESAASPTSNADVQYYHLSPPSQTYGTLGRSYQSMSLEKRKKKDQSVATIRNIPEVYLTRLLTCKGTIQKFVTDFFDSVMFVHPHDPIPVILKYVLDFLDREAERNSITNPEIIHAWKTNAIVLRFWMQLIHNPDCLFDIQRQTCLDASLTVIGQTLMDSFSQSEYPLGKESTSSKLLFAKDIAKYRPFAVNMFLKLKAQPMVDEKVFHEHINIISKSHNEGLFGSFAVNELLHWVKGNGLRLVEMLARDQVAIHHRLAERLEQIVHCTLTDQEHIYATLN
uniref:Sema domain-containing protein n=1 Tax=Panagrolaimus sp. JU765 TaxID=591449 RepID=A0AC34RI63_9BILA